MGKIGDLWVRLRLKDDEYRRSLSSSEQRTQTFGEKVKANWLKITAGIAAVTVAIRGFEQAFKKIADFEQANANLSTILGATKDQMKELSDSALRLGRTTEYTATDVTNLQTELAKLGFTPNQIQNMEDSVLHFATAVGADLPSAAAFAGSTLRAFGLSTKDTEKALTILALATNRSALSFSYLETSMSIVGPVAKTFGLDVADTATLLGTLSNAGFDASSAATALRNILLNLANSGGKLSKAIGHPVKNFNDLKEGFKAVREKGVDLNDTLLLTDKRSVAAFNTLLAGVDSLDALRASIVGANGVLEEMATVRINTVNGSIKLMQSAWEGFILSMSKSKGVIKGVIDFLTRSIEGVTLTLFPDARKQQWQEMYSGNIKTSAAESGNEFTKNYYAGQIASLEKQIQAQQYEERKQPILNRVFDSWDKKSKRMIERLNGLKAAYNSFLESISNPEKIQSAADTSADGANGADPLADILASNKADKLEKQRKERMAKIGVQAAKAFAEGYRGEAKSIGNLTTEQLKLGTDKLKDMLEKSGSAAGRAHIQAMVDAMESEMDKRDAAAGLRKYMVQLNKDNADFVKKVKSESKADQLKEAVDSVGKSLSGDHEDIENWIGDWIENDLTNSIHKAEDLANEFKESVAYGFSDGVQTIMDSLMGLNDVNAGDVFKALLTPLADMAVREGEILLASGIGVETLKKSLESMNGVAAIAAGAALITIGAAAKSGLQAMANGMSGGSSETTYSGGSSASSSQTIKSEMTVYVSGKISGNDIVISGQRTLNQWKR